jgi:hypothetical protein
MPITHGSITKANLILNGFDPEDVSKLSSDAADINNSKYHITFLGSSHQPVHDPVPITNALGELASSGAVDPNQFRLNFIGNFITDQLRAKTCKLAEKHGIRDSVRIEGFMGHSRAIAFLTETDLALVNTSTDAIPYKFAEYVGARKKILAYVPKSSHVWDLSKNQASICLVEHGQFEELKEKVRLHINGKEESSYSESFRRKFDLSYITKKLSRLYKSPSGTGSDLSREEMITA